MTTAGRGTPPIAGEQLGTRIVFLIAGTVISTWAPLIPFAKSRLRLGDAQLGLLLLCLATGSILAMPLAGALAARFGCRRMIVASVVVICSSLPVLATATHVWTLAPALLCFGASVGTLDVVMNLQAVIVERDSGRAMMSGFHGLYSVGGIAGAGSVGLIVSLGATPLVAVLVVVALAFSLLAGCARSLLPYGGDRDAPAFVLPHGRVLLLGAFCFVLFLAEGAVLDWSAVFLATVRHVPAARAGVGYVVFAAAMTTCRLAGDAIVRAVGPARVVLLGGLCAAGGLLLAATTPNVPAALAGFALVGVGASNVVPVMFSAVGRQDAMPTNLAIAAMTTLGYAGILAGPAVIGFIASAFGLPVGLTFVGVLLVGVALASTRMRF